MTDVSWNRAKQIVSVVAALIPLTGSVIVVYSGLEVVKAQVHSLDDDNVELRLELQRFRSEYQSDIRDLRSEIRELRSWRGEQ